MSRIHIVGAALAATLAFGAITSTASAASFTSGDFSAWVPPSTRYVDNCTVKRSGRRYGAHREPPQDRRSSGQLRFGPQRHQGDGLGGVLERLFVDQLGIQHRRDALLPGWMGTWHWASCTVLPFVARIPTSTTTGSPLPWCRQKT